MNGFKTLDELIHHKRSIGCFTFTIDEAKEKLTASPDSIKQALWRYQKNNKIRLIRKGFYTIVLPEYSDDGSIPFYLYINDLMKWLTRNYYLSLFTAASFHGASHQQPQETYVMIEPPPLRKIKSGSTAITFTLKERWDEPDIVERKTDSGFIKLSSPELTCIDLISYNRKISLNAAVTIISDMSESLISVRMKETSERNKKSSVLQRLGYIFENIIQRDDLAESVYEALNHSDLHYVPLSPHYLKSGEHNSKWRIVVNTDIDIDQ